MRYLEHSLYRRDGDVECRLYERAPSTRGALFVGGIGGGFDSPARELYPRLAEELPDEGISCVHLRFRAPTSLDESVADVLTGVGFLVERGVERVGLVGHSFGGAAVIRAAAEARVVRAVVALAPQSAGAEPAASLAPRCALLCVHGLEDEVLPPRCSSHIHERAGEPKQLLLFPGAGHKLDEVADGVHDAVRQWLVSHLSPGAEPSPALPGAQRPLRRR